jgi:hypothetical protein
VYINGAKEHYNTHLGERPSRLSQIKQKEMAVRNTVRSRELP